MGYLNWFGAATDILGIAIIVYWLTQTPNTTKGKH